MAPHSSSLGIVQLQAQTQSRVERLFRDRALVICGIPTFHETTQVVPPYVAPSPFRTVVPF